MFGIKQRAERPDLFHGPPRVCVSELRMTCIRAGLDSIRFPASAAPLIHEAVGGGLPLRSSIIRVLKWVTIIIL